MVIFAGMLHLAVLLVGPIVLVGVINRTKSLWTGRRGVPIWQLYFDLARLWRKEPVYSTVSTHLVRWAPYIALASAFVSGLCVPVLGVDAPATFHFDFVFVAYAWGLGRFALMLGALDTGSAFEGMGASREAMLSALVEPVLFLAAGALASTTGLNTFSGMLIAMRVDSATAAVTWVGSLIAMVVLLQVEAARMPIDDPSTHLELTMIHEVMILDHSGPDLAAVQYGAAMKMFIISGLVATLLNPMVASARPAVVMGANLVLTVMVGVFIGSVESLMARLKLQAIPRYIATALAVAFVALLASAWRMHAPT